MAWKTPERLLNCLQYTETETENRFYRSKLSGEWLPNLRIYFALYTFNHTYYRLPTRGSLGGRGGGSLSRGAEATAAVGTHPTGMHSC